MLGDNEKTLAEAEAGLRVSPDDADLLSAAVLAELSLGRWEAAVAHLQRGQVLDPRSATMARRLAHSLLRLRR